MASNPPDIVVFLDGDFSDNPQELTRLIGPIVSGSADLVLGSRVMGQAAKGIGLIEQGIAKGNLKNPEDAKLRLGMAQIQQLSTKAKGLQTLRSLKGTDGVADIGRLWTVLAR